MKGPHDYPLVAALAPFLILSSVALSLLWLGVVLRRGGRR